MRNMIKKFIIYSLVGILQFGLVAGIAEASPRNDRQHQRVEQSDRHRQNQQRLHDQRERERRHQEENSRHEREMQRRDHESDRAWRDRQHYESERHDQALKEIGVAVLLFMLLSQ